MPPQSPSSVAPSHSETCNLCSRDTYGCHCGGTFRQPSLLLPPLALAHEQQQDPFTDEHALQPEPQDVIAAGNDTPGPAAAGSSSQQASDDGLPSGSLPSRHTISAQPSPSRAPSPDRQPQPLRTRSLDTARLLSQAPPPLAPQAPTSEQVPLATIPLLHLDLASPRSRNSPKRQPTILHPPFTPRSEIAPIYSAGEHTWQMERSRQDLELFRTPSIGVLAGRMSTVRAARAVTGQKKPFPLIAPVLAQEKQKSTTEDSKAQEREHSEVDGSKESRSRRLFLLIVLLFQLCLLAATTAVVIWIKDLYGKQHVLRASTVSVAVIGGAGCCACGLWGWGLWVRRRGGEERGVAEVGPVSEDGSENESKPESESEKSWGNVCVWWHEKVERKEEVGAGDGRQGSIAAGWEHVFGNLGGGRKEGERVGDGERRHDLSTSGYRASLLRFREQGEDRRRDQESENHISKSRSTQAPSLRSTIPVSLLPTWTSDHEDPPAFRPARAASYRQRLESRLQSREHMGPHPSQTASVHRIAVEDGKTSSERDLLFQLLLLETEMHEGVGVGQEASGQDEADIRSTGNSTHGQSHDAERNNLRIADSLNDALLSTSIVQEPTSPKQQQSASPTLSAADLSNQETSFPQEPPPQAHPDPLDHSQQQVSPISTFSPFSKTFSPLSPTNRDSSSSSPDLSSSPTAPNTPTSRPFSSNPNLLNPSPTVPSSFLISASTSSYHTPSPTPLPIPPQTPQRSSGDYSETSSIREERLRASEEKVKVWRKYMVDLEESKGGEHGPASERGNERGKGIFGRTRRAKTWAGARYGIGIGRGRAKEMGGDGEGEGGDGDGGLRRVRTDVDV